MIEHAARTRRKRADVQGILEIQRSPYVSATVEDWQSVINDCAKYHQMIIDKSKLPEKFYPRLAHVYQNGDYVSTKIYLDLNEFNIKTKSQRKFREPNDDELFILWKIIRNYLPTIAYYPTFVFDFPDRIYLTTGNDTPRNRFYRQLFQDIL